MRTSPQRELDDRAAERTNLFLAATLHSGDSACPVKIRNLSATGAQVEGVSPPDVGCVMTLVRGRLSVRGHVCWSTQHRCGLHFSARVSVRDWMANPVNAEQQRVDHAIAMVKAGAVPIGPAAYHEWAAADGLVADLNGVSKLLEMLSNALADDPAVVTGHGIALQNLDIALQTLTALAAMVHVEAAEREAGVVRLDELRISCAQALQAR